MPLMTAEQIETELATLDGRIALAGAPTHPVEVLQLRQAKQRREMLQAELKRVNATQET
jgi:hypothetical protein